MKKLFLLLSLFFVGIFSASNQVSAQNLNENYNICYSNDGNFNTYFFSISDCTGMGVLSGGVINNTNDELIITGDRRDFADFEIDGVVQDSYIGNMVVTIINDDNYRILYESPSGTGEELIIDINSILTPNLGSPTFFVNNYEKPHLVSGIGLTFSNITNNTTLLIGGVIGVFFAGILAIFLLPILIRYVRSYIDNSTR